MPNSERDELTDAVQQLRKAVFGNGKVGLMEQVRTNTDTLGSLQQSIALANGKLDEIQRSQVEMMHTQAKDQAIAEAKRDGQRVTLQWIKWGLSALLVLIVIGGSLGLWQQQERWTDLQRLIQQLPEFP